MATDAAEANGLPLLEMSDELKQQFRKNMPWFGSPNNPIDLTGQASADSYERRHKDGSRERTDNWSRSHVLRSGLPRSNRARQEDILFS
ncbi:hypothetical protein [Fervidicoccus fontis]|nr:hypothetical protein [Fervidicoccus fontis]